MSETSIPAGGAMKRWWLLLAVLALELIYFVINRSFGNVHYLSTTFDANLPVVPILVVPYLAFHLVNWGTIIYAFVKQRKFTQFACALITLHLVAYLIYLLYQTAVIRPEIQSHDWASNILAWLYAHDRPYNALPSLHTTGSVVLGSYYFVIGSRYKWLVAIFCLVVIASTVLLKQHYIVDVFAGLILGSIVVRTFLFPSKAISA